MPPRSDLLVLCYHAVSETWPAELATTPHRLERQIEYLLGRGYRPATFSAAVASPPAGRRFVVTFDDAYRSTLTLGKPILDRLGVPGTVFVPTAYAGIDKPMVWPGIDRWMGGPHESELVPMSWPELGMLASAGWEIGSHTATHPRLTRLGDEELGRELAQSRDRCAQEIGAPCLSIAYPYGDVDARVAQATRDAGYVAGAALPAQMYEPRPLEWPRVGVYSIDTPMRFAVKVSPAIRRLRVALGR